MALITCKACNGQISRNAQACPHCGEPPPKRTGLLTWIIAGLMGYAVFQCSSMTDRAATSASPEQHAARERERQAERFLSDARLECRFAIRQFLKDPASAKYEDEDTAPVDVKGNAVHVTMLVRAKNSFGATVAQRFRCEGEIAGGKVRIKQVVGP